jgi:glycosyltransferase involved in cell wall biosynthesis
MACGKPSVSTAIRDVVEPYGHVVPVRPDAAGFIDACETIMRRLPNERTAWQSQVDEIIANTSWDATAARMIDMIDSARAAREAKILSATPGITAELRLDTSGLAAAS